MANGWQRLSVFRVRITSQASAILQAKANHSILLRPIKKGYSPCHTIGWESRPIG
jgi:hypothetical protein